MDPEQRMDRLEEDLASTVKLVKMSMQIALQNQQAINALIAAQIRADARMEKADGRQRRSDEKFDRLIASLFSKGRAKKKLLAISH